MTSCLVISEKNSRQRVFESSPSPGECQNFASLNIRLDKDVSPFHLTEGLLEERLRDLENLGSGSGVAYWLTFARLAELALFCGGTYADAGEFSVSGDLLVNPRLVLVHLRGRAQAVTKERHLPLSEQFREVADSARGVIQWLKHNTIVSVEKEPLLPLFYETLKSSGRFRQPYLDSVDGRMKRIADTLTFLAAENKGSRRGPCSYRLGRECRHVLEGETIISRYLGPIDGRLNATVPKAKYEDWKGLGI